MSASIFTPTAQLGVMMDWQTNEKLIPNSILELRKLKGDWEADAYNELLEIRGDSDKHTIESMDELNGGKDQRHAKPTD